jgi:hypothetical protein
MIRADRPAILVLAPLEGQIRIGTRGVGNDGDVRRLALWLDRDDARADLLCDFLLNLRALDRADDDRPGSDNRPR